MALIPPGGQQAKLARALRQLLRPCRHALEDELAGSYLHRARKFIEKRLPHQSARDYLAAAYGHQAAQEMHELVRSLTTEPDPPPQGRRFHVEMHPDAEEIAHRHARREAEPLVQEFVGKCLGKLAPVLVPGVPFAVWVRSCAFDRGRLEAELRLEVPGWAAFTGRVCCLRGRSRRHRGLRPVRLDVPRPPAALGGAVPPVLLPGHPGPVRRGGPGTLRSLARPPGQSDRSRVTPSRELAAPAPGGRHSRRVSFGGRRQGDDPAPLRAQRASLFNGPIEG